MTMLKHQLSVLIFSLESHVVIAGGHEARMREGSFRRRRDLSEQEMRLCITGS